MSGKANGKADDVVVWAMGVVANEPITTGTANHLRSLVRQLFHDALPIELADDRFDSDFTQQTDYRATVGLVGDTCVAYVGGGVSRGRLQLDALVSTRHFGPEANNDDREAAAELVSSLYHQTIASPPADVSTVELWGRPGFGWHALAAEQCGLIEGRSLHQLRCSLPIAENISTKSKSGATVATRPFEPGEDEQRLLSVNNRAFAYHPDQGNLTASDLSKTMAEDWFDPDGVRLYDDPSDPNKLAGFCWTKIHRARNVGNPIENNQDDELGEIYAIGIDPDHHGQGLGRPMTAAGLDWLTQHDISTGMLYVESDNEPALRTYERLGFTNHRTDRSWRVDL